jgi:hypothetical protein
LIFEFDFMLFNVPQYVDVEDKVAGPLTGKQLLWMFGMGVAVLIIWNIFEKPTVYFVAIPVAGLFVALAFYRPYNQPLIKFIGNAIMFVSQPKFYTWKRTAIKRTTKPRPKQNQPQTAYESGKLVSSDEIENLARLADSGGHEHGKEILEIIEKHRGLKKKK